MTSALVTGHLTKMVHILQHFYSSRDMTPMGLNSGSHYLIHTVLIIFSQIRGQQSLNKVQRQVRTIRKFPTTQNEAKQTSDNQLDYLYMT